MSLLFIFIILSYGVSIKAIILPFIKLEELYIQYDKKLIVKAKNIYIKNEKNHQSSNEELMALTEKISLLNRFFKEIEIGNIHYDNENIQLLFRDGIFYIDNNLLTLATYISPEQEGIRLEINYLQLKEYALTIRGRADVNLRTLDADFKGVYALYGTQGDLTLRKEDTMVYYDLTTKESTSIHQFIDVIGNRYQLDALLEVFDKLKAQSFLLHSLSGKFDYEKEDFFLGDITASCSAKNPTYRFHPNLPPLRADDAYAVLSNDSLHIELHNPTYLDKALNGSYIGIHNLLVEGKSSVVDLILNTHSSLDDTVLNVLKTYNIHLPIRQLKGKTEAVVRLNITYRPYRVFSELFIQSHEAIYEVDGIPTKSKRVHIEKFKGPLLHFKDTNLNLSNTLNFNYNGTLNIDTMHFSGRADINKLSIKSGKDSILSMSRIKTDMHGDFLKKNTRITLPKLKSTIHLNDHRFTIHVDDLAQLYPYSDILKEYDIDRGKAVVKTEAFEAFDLRITLPKLPYILTPKKPIKKEYVFDATIDKDSNLTITNHDKSISLVMKRYRIEGYINGYDLDVSKYTDKHSKKKPVLHKNTIVLKGKNAYLILDKTGKKLLSDHFTATLVGKRLTYNGRFKKGDVTLKQNGQRVGFKATNMPVDFLDALTQKNIFHQGRFDIDLAGTMQKANGKITITKSHLKESSTINNIVAFINTAPSLVTFRNPDYSSIGFNIKEGSIDFSLENERIKLNRIDFHGNSTDISGKGTVDSRKKSINLNLELSTFKSVSGIVKHIPIVGYLVLGEDGTISTSIDVNGSLSDPIVKTHLVKDTIVAPFKILQRTLSLPFTVFDTNMTK
jgi:hypothetical protein